MEVESPPRPTSLSQNSLPPSPCDDDLNLSPATRSRRGRFAVDPDTCLEVFRTHWGQALAIMGKEQCPITSDDIDPVMHYLDQMLALLIEEPPPERPMGGRSPVMGPPPIPGPILECAIDMDVFDRVFKWSCNSSGDLRERLKEQQLLLYEMVIAQSRQSLLLHRPILRPLTKLINMCGMRSSVGVEKCLVRILHQLAICVTRDPRLLVLCQSVGQEEIMQSHFLLDQLIHFMHRDGEIGLEANHALSLLIALSSRDDAFGICIATESHFCPVLACALSGLYSSLPRKINIPSDDWHRLRSSDIASMTDMTNFLRQLDFCNTVIEIGHPKIKYSLLKFIHSGFLVNVLGASLHQITDAELQCDTFTEAMQNSLDEVIAATAYLELFLRRIRAPSLLAMFLKFIITDSYDNYPILDSLISRINYNTMVERSGMHTLGIVTMSLFKTILDFHCEDVMYYLVFRYLIPCRHFMESQRRCINDMDGLIRSADRFQALIPTCCLLLRSNVPNPDRNDDSSSFNSSNPDSLCSSATSSVLNLSVPGDGSAPPTPRHGAEEQPAVPERLLYVEYLNDANGYITERELAVAGWEFPYDGVNPPSNVYDQPSAPATQVQSTFRRFLTKRDDSPLLSEESLSLPLISSSTPPDSDTETPHTPEVQERKRKPSMKMKSALYTLSYLDDDDDDNEEEGEPQEEEEEEENYEETLADVQCATSMESFLDALTRVRPSDNAEKEDEEMTLTEFDRLVSSVTAKWCGVKSGEEGMKTESQSDVEEAIMNGEMDSGLGGSSSADVPMPRPVKLARPPGYTPTGPATVGPFLTTLLCKLESMAGNSFYVNLLITGLLSSLAAYPCPLLRSFLLHTGLVLQPSVKSLHHILFSVRQAVDSHSCTTAHFDLLLQRARSYMQRRVGGLVPPQRRYTVTTTDDSIEIGVDAVLSVSDSAGRRTESLLVNLPPERRATTQMAAPAESRRRPKLLDLFARRSGSDLGRGFLSSSRRKRKEEVELEEALSSVKTRNMVYAALILEEFTKELAALCQEHAVRPR